MQKRRYKAEKKKNGVWFAVLCAAAVFAVAAVSALLARHFRAEVPAVTTDRTSETVTATETVAPETTAFPETTLPPVTTVPPETTVGDGVPVTTAVTETTEHTVVSVPETDGMRRIESFISMETDTPEYRLAELLLSEVPPVVKTMVVTETAEPVGSDVPVAPSETTLDPASGDPPLTTAVSAPPVTVTYEVPGSAAVYYKDLTDGEVIAFAPDKTYYGASMIKAVYVYALLQVADRGEIDLEEKIVYTKGMFVAGSGNFKNVEDGEEFTVRELISATMRYSDNTAYAMLVARFGTDFFASVLEENGLTPARYSAWWRGTAEQFGAFFAVLHGYLTSESENGRWLAEEMVHSMQTVMLQRALAPEKVAHKYGWDANSYCDGAVVLNETHPYVVVFLSNMDEGHLKRANTNFIYEVGGLIKQMHDAKYAAAETAVSE